MMVASNNVVEKIKEFEGFRACAYKCPAGIWTIGYGHTSGVKKGDKISKERAEKFLREDLKKCYPVIMKCRGDFNQNQFDSLCSFVFNLGSRKFESSTLYKVLQKDRFSDEVGKQIRRWVYSGKSVLKGLVKRREWEAQNYYA